jgi:hypothetical protein
VQSATGRLLTDINIAGASSDRVNVSGTADLAPKFYPAVSSLLAFGLPCLAVEATGAGAEPLA